MSATATTATAAALAPAVRPASFRSSAPVRRTATPLYFRPRTGFVATGRPEGGRLAAVLT